MPPTESQRKHHVVSAEWTPSVAARAHIGVSLAQARAWFLSLADHPELYRFGSHRGFVFTRGRFGEVGARFETEELFGGIRLTLKFESILTKIRDVLFGSQIGELRDPTGIYLYAKCDACGAPVRVRVDKLHELQRDFDSGGFVLRKEIMDGTCFALMQATVRFDARYTIVGSEITGGQLISWEEYRALTTPDATPR